ncbi:hypothetical protein ELQ87_01865 [Streptomyces griseoviridis]|uniref:DUF4118 domain-containing protein n=1 Tax=Streptomyces griseoviridis TaxID=45398 RepID=A0A3Q9KS93_STRGD|nr:hypothetical protein [Streptomyces griseoviridis]AZS83177.1 hypothetical protein ELQ87_01865 [Streptomyces griseoviridis]QCN89969.1 hypothetical protein DDJ31_37500 [Streptomyces griseoviridis]
MIERMTLRVAARPVPQPVAAPLVWFGAFGGAALLVALLNSTAGPGRPLLVLVALSVFAIVLGLCASFAAAPGTAVLCWLFLNGFGIPPAGTLTWVAQRDARWIACLLGATLVGTLVARVVNARAAYRHLTPAVFTEPPETESPPPAR